MIKGFFQKRKQQKAIREFQQSPLGEALTMHTQTYFREYSRLAGFDEDSKSALVGNFVEQIFKIMNADNPVLATREALVDYVLGYAALQVLCLKEEEKLAAFYADSPYISGELYKHIVKAASFNDELDKLMWKHNNDLSQDELIDFCNTRCLVFLYYVNGLNLVRIALGDSDQEKDWFKPFIKSMLIWKEDDYRDKLGLPSLHPDSTNGLIHGDFMNAVLNGHKNPYYDWEKNWSDID